MENTRNNNQAVKEVNKKKESIIRYSKLINVLQNKNDSIVRELKEELNPNTYAKLNTEKALVNELYGVLTRYVEEVEL